MRKEHHSLNVLRQDAYRRLDTLRLFFRSQGLREQAVRRSLVFDEILYSLPVSEWSWLLNVQQQRVAAQQEEITDVVD